MKRLCGILILIALFPFACETVDALITRSLRNKARSVHVGDSKGEVERLLGRPIAVLTPSVISAQADTNWVAAILSVPAETWVYGDRLDLRNSLSTEAPYFYPFRLRLFGLDPDDINIEFNSSGRVAKVAVP